MNLALAQKLLIAVDEQPHGFLKVRDRESIHEVERLAAAGLVKASVSNDYSQSSAVIKYITDAGYKFLRAFRDQAMVNAVAGNSAAGNSNSRSSASSLA